MYDSYLEYLKKIENSLARNGIHLGVDLSVSKDVIQEQVGVFESFFFVNNLLRISGSVNVYRGIYSQNSLSYLRQEIFDEYQDIWNEELKGLTVQPDNAGKIEKEVKPISFEEISNFTEGVGLVPITNEGFDSSNQYESTMDDGVNTTEPLSDYSEGLGLYGIGHSDIELDDDEEDFEFEYEDEDEFEEEDDSDSDVLEFEYEDEDDLDEEDESDFDSLEFEYEEDEDDSESDDLDFEFEEEEEDDFDDESSDDLDFEFEEEDEYEDINDSEEDFDYEFEEEDEYEDLEEEEEDDFNYDFEEEEEYEDLEEKEEDDFDYEYEEEDEEEEDSEYEGEEDDFDYEYEEEEEDEEYDEEEDDFDVDDDFEYEEDEDDDEDLSISDFMSSDPQKQPKESTIPETPVQVKNLHQQPDAMANVLVKGVNKLYGVGRKYLYNDGGNNNENT